MSETSKREYLAGARGRYARRNRAGKTRLLDEVCEALGWERKHAIKALNGKRSKGGRRGRSGRKKDYGPEVAEVVASIWKSSEQPCSLRLKVVLREWLPSYETRHGELGEELRKKVLGASPRTLERLLEGRKCGATGRLRKRGRTSHALKKRESGKAGGSIFLHNSELPTHPTGAPPLARRPTHPPLPLIPLWQLPATQIR